jgi:hypothetical protein
VEIRGCWRASCDDPLQRKKQGTFRNAVDLCLAVDAAASVDDAQEEAAACRSAYWLIGQVVFSSWTNPPFTFIQRP